MFAPTKIEEFHPGILIAVLALMILFLFVLAYLCNRVFVPMLGRLMNSKLVEEHGEENSRDMKNDPEPVEVEPPPSSDRQNINGLRGP